MGKRFNVYLDEESEILFNELNNRVNEVRQNECDKTHKRYKPIGMSELIQQLVKKSYRDERKEIIDKLNHHCKMGDFYEDKLKSLNSTFQDTLINNTTENEGKNTEYN